MWTIFLSIKYFFSRRKEGMISIIGFISIIGVALGIAALIIVLSIMNGFDQEIKKKIIGTYSHVVIMKETGIADYENIIDKIVKLPGVTGAAAFITGQAVIKSGKNVTGILLKGIDAGKETAVTEVVSYTGDEASKLDGDTIILGSELMKEGNINPGDTIQLIIPYSQFDMEKVKLKVIGSFTSGRYDYDANIAVVDIKTADKIFRKKNTVSGIGLKVQDEMNVNDVKKMLIDRFGYSYNIKSWMDLDRNLITALALEKKMMFIILALIVMVACFNICGSLIMMIMEKTKDIGILKAIGASSMGVSFVFLFQGIFIGLMGVLIGGAAGVFLAERINVVADFLERITGITVFPDDIYYFTKIPVALSNDDVLTVIVVAFTLVLSAGIYPAWKASRLDPVEAIRYE